MVAFFQSLHKTLAAGVVLLIVLVILVGLISGQWIQLNSAAWWAFFWRWLHIMAGVMWIGLLWYLNFVQTPTVPKIEPAEHRAAITKFIAPNVLFWFRYAALATVILGLILALQRNVLEDGYFLRAFTLQKPYHVIGIGMWLALIMAFNVWFIIWPNQKKVLGIVEATPDEKAAAARLAGMTSRINTMLSIPMLYCMVAARNVGL
jgi:uncharacterized membrane protein